MYITYNLLAWNWIKEKFDIKWIVCLFTLSLLAETHLGPDQTRTKCASQSLIKSLYKYAGLVVYGKPY